MHRRRTRAFLVIIYSNNTIVAEEPGTMWITHLISVTMQLGDCGNLPASRSQQGRPAERSGNGRDMRSERTRAERERAAAAMCLGTFERATAASIPRQQGPTMKVNGMEG